MAIPWPLIAIGADFLLKKLDPKGYGGQIDIPDLNKMKGDLTLGDKDIRDLRQMSLRDIASINMKQMADIKQMGAAKRMPSGAITSAIQGTAERTAKGVSRIGPELKLAQIASNRNFFNTMLPYQRLRSEQASASAYQDQASLGGLAKIATLWQAGLLNFGGGPQQGQSLQGNNPGLLDPYQSEYGGFS